MEKDMFYHGRGLWKLCTLLLLFTAFPLLGKDLLISENWTLFGPYRNLWYRTPAGLQEKKIPPFLTVAGVRRNALKVRVKDGKLDLAEVYGKKIPRRAVYLCIPLEAKKDCSVILGCGADWNMQIALNGKKVYCTLKEGNDVWPPSAQDHAIPLQLKKGKHRLTVSFLGGRGSQQFFLKKLEKMPEKRAAKKVRESFGRDHLSVFRNISSASTREYRLENNGESIEFTARKGAGQGSVRRTIPLQLEAGQQYCLSWSAGTEWGSPPLFLITEKPDGGGIVYYSGKLQTGMDLQRYFFCDNPAVFAHVIFSKPGRSGISELRLRKCLTSAKRFADWRIQRYPAQKQFDTLSRSVKTAHLPLGKKLPGGKLPLFYILGYWDQRMAIELEQRFDFSFEGMFTNGAGHIPEDYFARTADGKICVKNQHALLAGLDRTKCIYIDGCGASSFSSVMAKKVREFVQKGGGVVLCAFDIPYYPYRSGKRQAALQAFRKKLSPLFDGKTKELPEGKQFVKVSAAGDLRAEFVSYGKGRAVLLLEAENVKGNTRRNFEIRSALIGKALMWASGRVPQVSIRSLIQKGKTLELALSGKNRAGALRGEVTFLDAEFNSVCTEEFSWKDKELGSVSIPEARRGGDLALVRLTSAAGVMDFDLVKLERTVPPRIRKLHFAVKNGLLRGSVQLLPGMKEEEKLLVRFTDMNGCLWFEKAFSGKILRQKRIPFSISLRGLPAISGDLQCLILGKNSGELYRTAKRVYFSGKDSPENADFHLGFWGAPVRNYPARLFYERFRDQYKLDFLLSGYHTKQVFDLAEMGIRATAAAAEGQTAFGRNNKVVGTKDAPERALCLTSPKLRRRMRRIIAQKVKPLAGMGIRSYFLDHEMHLLGFQNKARPGTEFCFSPSCLKHLRSFLEKEYKTLEDLNRNWNTSYTSWDQVRPITLANALRNGQYVRWIDHRRHMDQVWTDTTAFRVKEVRKYDPAGIGYVQNLHSGYTTLDSFNGIDYEQLFDCPIGAGGVPEPYLGFIHKENRSVNSQGGSMWPPSGCATDHIAQGQLRASRQLWQALLGQRHNCLYYSHSFKHGVVLFNDIFITYPDLTLSPEGEALAKEMHRVTGGIDRLFLTAEPEDSRISMLYSRASEHVCTLWQRLHRKKIPFVREMDPRRAQFNVFAPAIENANYSFSAVTERQILKGFLQENKTKILILPMARSIDSATAGKIREFVRSGGILVADLMPGLSARNGRFYPAGLLDEVFGVKHPLNWDYKPFRLALELPLKNGKKVRLEKVYGGPEIKLTGARALKTVGNVPLFCVNSYGKGKAYLLNFYTEDPGFIHLFRQISASLPALFDYEMKKIQYDTYSGKLPLRKMKRETARIHHEDKSSTEDAGESESLIFENDSRPQLIRLRNGDCELLGFYAAKRGHALGEGSMEVTFRNNKKAHVYDLRNLRYVGYVSQWTVPMRLEDVAVFALLPFKAPSPEIKQLKVTAQKDGRKLLCAQLILPGAQNSLMNYPVRVQLITPGGKVYKGFERTVNTRRGRGKVDFVLPLNAPQGKWKILCTEVISNKKVSAAFEL